MRTAQTPSKRSGADEPPEISVAVAACLTTLGAVAATDALDPMPSRVYDWNVMPEQATAVGARRPFFRGETAALGELEAHVTTILPGNEPHPPHRHANEELIILLSGTLAVTVEQSTDTIGPGSSVFLAGDDLHGLRNVGTGPASYYVIQMRAR